MPKKMLISITAISLSFFFVIFSFGCKGQDGRDGRDGMDGEDGDSYVAYWFITPFSYVTDDPGIPSIIFSETYYQTNIGTYSLVYQTWDGSVWAVNYTISIDEGEPGERGERGEPGGLFWQDGKDGKDGNDGEDGVNLCFDIGCWSWGPSVYAHLECFGTVVGRTTGGQSNFIESYENELIKSGKMESSTDEIKAMSDLSLSDYLYEPDENDPQTNIKTILSGRYRIKLVYKQIK